jgi:hypothetical protein
MPNMPVHDPLRRPPDTTQTSDAILVRPARAYSLMTLETETLHGSDESGFALAISWDPLTQT